MHRRFLRAAPWALGGYLAFSAACAQAGFEQLLTAMERAPEAARWQLQRDLAAANTQQAAALANPSLSVQADDVYGSGRYRATDQAEYSWQVRQPLDVWGERRARAQAAQAGEQAVQAQTALARWQLSGELAARCGQVEASRARLQLAEQQQALAAADSSAIAKAVALGREAQLRALQAQSELEQAGTQTAQAQAELQTASAQLAQLLPADMTDAAAHCDVLARAHSTTSQPSNLTDVSAESLPAARLQQLQAQRAQAQQLLAQERAAAKPQVSATFGSKRYREESENALTLGVEMTLPVFDRRQGAIAAAATAVALADVELQTAARDIQAQRTAARVLAQAAETQYQHAQQAQAGLAQAYQLVREGYRAGRLNALELREARRALLVAQTQVIDAQLARLNAEITLAALQERAPFAAGELR